MGRISDYIEEGHTPLSSVCRSLCRGPDIGDQEVVVVYAETFEGDDVEFLSEGYTVKSDFTFSKVLNQKGIGFKSISKFEIELFSGECYTYSRGYRGQLFKRR